MRKLNELLIEFRGKESLREAAKRIGISHTYLDVIEKGFDKRSGKPVNPTPETLKLISKAYNYPYEELMRLAGYLENETDKGETAPEWATAKDKRDLKKFLESPEVLYFDGVEFTEEDRAKMLGMMEALFWDAKQKNKEAYRKSRENKKDN